MSLFTIHKDGSGHWREPSKKLIRMDSSADHDPVGIYSFSRGYFVTVGDEVTLEIAMTFRIAELWFERLKDESRAKREREIEVEVSRSLDYFDAACEGQE